MKRILLLAGLVWASLRAVGQDIDVEHYRYSIVLSDENDRVEGEAVVRVRLPEKTTRFSLDLVGEQGGKGMKVTQVNGEWVKGFRQEGDRVEIELRGAVPAGQVAEVAIRYGGVPRDGLIIARNKYGDRTFFSDNWPNRAHHWIPCNDQPSDKASVEFLVTAPTRYQVVSNGVQVEETALEGGRKRTHWKEVIPISTKVMVIGAAEFAVKQYADTTYCVPVSAWVYPKDREKGFHDYALATDMLKFFSDYIAPYPFRKLANIQSKTRFGGMENASAIFYNENSVTGNRESEDLVAHEIVHQWFGNTATEKSFTHLWLSEGFATYLTNIYFEHKYGKDHLAARLQEQREEVIGFARQSAMAVVDSTTPYMQLLNANSYQKGGWVLHMLRREVGDSVFHKVIRAYYRQFKGSNADTRDFQRVAEHVAGRDLSGFFNQWLYRPGVPRLEVSWAVAEKELLITALQKQKALYSFPLEVQVVDETGGREVHRLNITSAITTLPLPVKNKPVKVVLDPNTALLFEGGVIEKGR